MEIKVNGMKYLKHKSYFFGHMAQYLTIVFVEDISTGMTKEYADFINDENSEIEIEKIMRRGFKPKDLQAFLNEALAD